MVPHALADTDADDIVEADGATDPPVEPEPEGVSKPDSDIELVGDKEGVPDPDCDKERVPQDDALRDAERVPNGDAV